MTNDGNRAPGVIWLVRRDEEFPYVSTAPDDQVRITHVSSWTGLRDNFVMSRDTARLLAKRINQCLDATVKR